MKRNQFLAMIAVAPFVGLKLARVNQGKSILVLTTCNDAFEKEYIELNNKCSFDAKHTVQMIDLARKYRKDISRVLREHEYTYNNTLWNIHDKGSDVISGNGWYDNCYFEGGRYDEITMVG